MPDIRSFSNVVHVLFVGGAYQGEGGREGRDPPASAETHLQWKADVRYSSI